MQSALAIWILTAGSMTAENVLLKNGITVTGELLRYDERGVTIRLPSQQVREFDADEIRLVEAHFSPAHEAADGALERRELATALEQYQQALRLESRPWAQARIRTGLLRTLNGLRRLEPAASEFFTVAAVRTDVEVMTLAPLIWSPEEKADDAALTAARRWLGDAERPLAQLVAASWLLGTNDESRAVAVLERLQTDRQQRIGWLARAQLWRMRLRTATANDIDRYQGLVEKMPLAIRAGPQYVLGLALEQSGRTTEAALAYLWVPFVYDRHWRLADDALFRAAATTAQAGFADDARSLYRTLVREYPTSPRAAEATRRLRNESNPVPPSAGRGVTKESSR